MIKQYFVTTTPVWKSHTHTHTSLNFSLTITLFDIRNSIEILLEMLFMPGNSSLAHSLFPIEAKTYDSGIHCLRERLLEQKNGKICQFLAFSFKNRIINMGEKQRFWEKNAFEFEEPGHLYWLKKPEHTIWKNITTRV